MKRGMILSLFVLFLIFTITVLADNIYQYDNLEVELNVKGSFELQKETSGATISEANVDLLMVPKESFRQKVLKLETTGTLNKNNLSFHWETPLIEKQEFGYTALIKNYDKRKEVKNKIIFPLQDTNAQEKYLSPTIKIDSNNPKIIAKATELAEGENDLFKITFKLADWVEKNIEYDLNDLTTEQAQKASWVLENREGVCDEMTSLFVAMCRSLGIPAKFVSGISYTENEEVVRVAGSKWAGHGWAEVYFPEVGWVSFDITFREFGYIDVTHIKLTESSGPDESSTHYDWLANNVVLIPQGIETNIDIKNQGEEKNENIQLAQEILAEEVAPGSYNLIKAIIKNNADHYAATSLKLAVPKEISIVDKNSRNILLLPKEVRETYWIIKVSDNLKSNYEYTFPTIIYSEKNTSIQDSFTTTRGEQSYSLKDIEKLVVKDEEKSYSRKVDFNCDIPNSIKLNQPTKVSCKIKNIGNSNLNNLEFCLAQICHTINLPINQEETKEITLKAEEIGWNKIIISAENELVEKKESLQYMVIEEPVIKLIPTYPEEVNYGDKLSIALELKKLSFNTPKDVVITLDGPGFTSLWEIEELKVDEIISSELENVKLSWNNKMLIKMSWYDQEGNIYEHEEEFVIKAKSRSFKDKLIMAVNAFLNLF
jgi:hypothetical protein